GLAPAKPAHCRGPGNRPAEGGCRHRHRPSFSGHDRAAIPRPCAPHLRGRRAGHAPPGAGRQAHGSVLDVALSCRNPFGDHAEPAGEACRSSPGRTYMAGYSGTALAKKLGIKPGSRVFVEASPVAYEQLVAPLPAGVTLQSALDASTDLVHLFSTSREEL